MFEQLSQRFLNIKDRFFSSGKITEKNIEDGIQEVRKALIEADVNLNVIKKFIDRVKQESLGEKLIKSVKPGQQFIKIVSDELAALMGPVDHTINLAQGKPTVIMMVGLQGSGKTTTCGKLAKFLINKGMKPLLVAADIQRPAAIEQLMVHGQNLKIPVFSQPKLPPPKICSQSLAFAKEKGCDVIILDTAGRLHINEELMQELFEVKHLVKPDNIFLVMDAATGQDAVNSAKEFDERLAVNGIIMTKLDSDTRGGAALSVKEVTGKSIKFIGVGEQLDRLEEFHPERMADRILGKGDVVSLVERAQNVMDEEKAMEMQQKLLEATFTFEDFLEQFQMIKQMGNFKDLLGMLPGGLGAQLQGMDVDEKALAHTEAMIYSMTLEERRNPDLLEKDKTAKSRRTRIAKGSGRAVEEVNQLIKQFREMRNMMRNLGRMGGMGNLLGKFPGMSGMGAGKRQMLDHRNKRRK